MSEFTIKYTDNQDGTVTVSWEELEQLILERNQYFQDVSTAALHIGRMLKNLDMLDDHNEFQEPSWGKVAGVVGKLMFNPKAKSPFDHLKDLGPMLSNYTKLLNEKL